MPSENIALTSVSPEIATATVNVQDPLLGGESTNLNVHAKSSNKTLVVLKIVLKVLLALTIILYSVMVSIGYLEPEMANNTIKALTDLRSVITAALEWRNETKMN